YQAYESITTLVAPFWQDLYPVSGTDNNVFWGVIGTAPNRELVIEWRNVESYECRGDSSATVKFQAVFREGSSDVLFNYANASFGGNCSDEDHGGRAEVGIQVAPTQATTWGYEEPLLGDATGILWQLAGGTPVSNPVPVVNSVSPSTVQAGGPDFVFGASVQWNGTSVNTDYYGPNKLVGAILGDLIANPGTAQITVDNLNQGGISNAVPFTITAPTMQSAVVADQTMALQGRIGNPELLRVPGTIKSPKFLPRL